MPQKQRGLDTLQKISMSLMGVLVLITFVGANLHALLWQSSDWLVSTVLPAVVVDLTNEERSDLSTQPLQRNAVLDDAAKLKAQHMAKNEYFAHFSPDGVSPWHWFDEAGYVYAHAGENLAIHFTDSSEVVEAWMKSPTHRQNIVNGLYTEIGVGTAKGSYEGYDTVYVVQLFGTPAVPPTAVQSEPLVIATAPTSPVTTVVATESVVVPEVKTEVLISMSEVVLSEETTTIPVEEITDDSLPFVSSEIESSKVDIVIEDTVVDVPTFVQANDALEVIVVQSPVIATSSGLAVASIDTSASAHAGGTLASVVTQPNSLLQMMYFVLALAVVVMLGSSVVIEARKMRFQQVAYGFMLLVGMGGLWFVNSILTNGAVII